MLVVTGCTGWQNPLIKQAWQEIDDKPEAARTILAKVHYNSLSESDKAEYGLLSAIVGNIPEAVGDFKVAETIAEKSNDEELKSRVYERLFYANFYIGSNTSVIKYARKLLNSSTHLNDSTMMLKSMLMCATAHADMDRMDSAQRIRLYKERYKAEEGCRLVPVGRCRCQRYQMVSHDGLHP